MSSDILESVITITKQRDSDSLEFSLIATMVDLIKVTEISLLKQLDGRYRGQLERVVHVTVTTDAPQSQKTDWEQQSCLVTDNNEIKHCLRSNQVISCMTNDNHYCHYFPINVGHKTTGLLAIKTIEQTIKSSDVVINFIKIYENYQYLLNENERDKLTGLLNRKTFDAKLNRLLGSQTYCDFNNKATEASAWLVMIDIDHFKHVNDTYGHIAGDEILLLFAQKSLHFFANNDLFFRFGGEEFVTLLPNMPQAQAMDMLNQFKDFISHIEFPIAGRITISLGLAKITAADYPPTILHYADRALYYAKQHGRNLACSYEQLLKENKLPSAQDESTIELF